MDNEIPIGARERRYRLFEMLPALVSYTALGLLVVLSLVSPNVAAWYVLAIVLIMFGRALRGAIDMIRGYRRLRGAESVNWNRRLVELSDPRAVLARGEITASGMWGSLSHLRALRAIATDPQSYPDPQEVYQAVIVAAYNEPYEVIAPTIRSISESRIDLSRVMVFFAYEERGGAQIAETAARLKREFGELFGAFELVCHPAGVSGEIAGKGANITYAGRALEHWVYENEIDPAMVLVTTLDCDNKPHRYYLAAAAYHFVLRRDRGRAAFQPISIFNGNIWDAPAPTRVVASGNTFWNIIASVRPLSLRNFASHSQPLDALIGMDFWSKRTIVEDGHQYWRSYFHFRGNYKVVPIPLPIYQDAVLADTYRGTIAAQFKQLSRWSYGASDVPYVAVRIFGKKRVAPFWPSFGRFLSLLESQVTLASIPIIIAIGGWIPIFLAGRAARHDHFVANLPYLIGSVQQIAMIGVVISVVLTWRMLPPRPSHVAASRKLGMVLQWLLFPITGIVFNSLTALHSQGSLMFGRYRERFDVTAKSAVSAERNSAASAERSAAEKTSEARRAEEFDALS